MHMKVVPTGCQGGLPVQPAARRRRRAPDAHPPEGAMLVTRWRCSRVRVCLVRWCLCAVGRR